MEQENNSSVSQSSSQDPEVPQAGTLPFQPPVVPQLGQLLHEPTVRVRELANETGAVSYAAALAELFALDPEAVSAVTRPEGLSS